MQDYYRLLTDEPALREVENNTAGSRPKELFLDVIEQLEEEYMRQRNYIQLAADAAGVALVHIDADSPSFQDFIQSSDFSRVLDSTAAEKVTPSCVRLFIQDVRGRAIKADRMAREAFLALLGRTEGLDVNSTYLDAEQMCGSLSEWVAVAGGEEERQTLFDEFQRHLISAARQHVSAEVESSRDERNRRNEKGIRHKQEKEHQKKKKRRHSFGSESDEEGDAEGKHQSHGRRHKRSDRERRGPRKRSHSRGRWKGRNREGSGESELEEGEVQLATAN